MLSAIAPLDEEEENPGSNEKNGKSAPRTMAEIRGIRSTFIWVVQGNSAGGKLNQREPIRKLQVSVGVYISSVD